MTSQLADAIADEQSREPGLLAQTAPERVSEAESATEPPKPVESHSDEMPPVSEANPADDGVCICGDTGVFEGAGCWACDLGTTACRFCGTHDEPRAYDSAGKVACVDEEACAVRDAATAAPVEGRDVPDEPEFHDDNGPAAPTAPAPSEIGNHETPGWDAPAPKDDAPDTACQLCGSTKAQTVYVTDGRLGSDDEGVWRCAAASDCKRRIAVKAAREQLAE